MEYWVAGGRVPALESIAARDRARALSTLMNISNSFFWTSWCSAIGFPPWMRCLQYASASSKAARATPVKMADIPALGPGGGAERVRAGGGGGGAVVWLRDRPAADVLALAVLAERDDHLLHQVRVAAHRSEREGEGRDADGDSEVGAAPAPLLGGGVTGAGGPVG